MVVLTLEARCESIDGPLAGFRIAEPDTAQFSLIVSCPSCGEEHKNPVTVSGSEIHEVPGSRGEANFVWRCGFCRRHGSIQVVPVSAAGQIATVSKNEPPVASADSFTALVGLECRGVDVKGWELTSGLLIALSDDMKKTYPVELEDGASGEWCDYDDEKNASIGLYGLETRIGTLR